MSGATATHYLIRAIQALKAAGVDTPGTDARRLLAHVWGVEADRLTLHLNDDLPADVAARFDAALARRTGREPVSHITGARAFYGREFSVNAEVLDPRPETEILVEQALKLPFDSVLDLGTGSGAILLSLLSERPGAHGVATDISIDALKTARTNAAAFGLCHRARFLRSDWFKAVSGRFDLIVSNPPYIAPAEMTGLSPEVRDWEPDLALTDGLDGLSAYRIICAAAPQYLHEGGWLMVEIGPTQSDAVCGYFAAAGFCNFSVVSDLDCRPRVVIGQVAQEPLLSHI